MKFCRNNESAIKWLATAHMTCDIYTGLLNPIMPFIAAKLGFTMAIATVIISISQIFSNLLQPIFGFFADNITKRFFVFWGLILVSTFIPMTSLAPNVVILTLFMIFGCLGSSFFHPQSTGFINFLSIKNCSNNMGIFIGLGTLGFAFGPLLAAYITQYFGLEKVSLLSFGGLVVAFCMFIFVPKFSQNNIEIKHKKFFKTFKEILSNAQMLMLMLIAMMKSLITNSFCILLPFLWKSMNYTPSYIGSALFLFVFSGAIASYLSPHAEKIFGSKKVIYFSLLSTLPLVLIFSFIYTASPILSIIVFGIIGFTTNLAQPVITVWAQNTLPEYKSIAAGFINGFCWGIVALIVSVTGVIAQNIGIMNVLIGIAVIPALSSYTLKFLKLGK